MSYTEMFAQAPAPDLPAHRGAKSPMRGNVTRTPLSVTDEMGEAVVGKSDVQLQILDLIGKQTTLNSGELAYLIRVFLERTGSNVLLWEAGKVVDGDLHCYRNSERVRRDRVGAVVCLGDLTVTGDVVLCDLEYTPFLLVAGTLRARNVVKGSQPLFVLGDVALQGYYLGIGNDGLLRVGGDLDAAGYIYRYSDSDALRGHVIAGKIRAPSFDYREWDLPLSVLQETFTPEVIRRDGLCNIAILARQHAGLPVWRDSSLPPGETIPQKVDPDDSRGIASISASTTAQQTGADSIARVAPSGPSKHHAAASTSTLRTLRSACRSTDR